MYDKFYKQTRKTRFTHLGQEDYTQRPFRINLVIYVMNALIGIMFLAILVAWAKHVHSNDAYYSTHRQEYMAVRLQPDLIPQQVNAKVLQNAGKVQ